MNDKHSGDSWRAHAPRLRSLVENASDVLTVVAPDLTIFFQGASGAEQLGYRPEELEGTKFGELVDSEGLRRLRAACAQAADGVGRRPVQLRLRRRDGTWLDGETVVRYEPGEGCLVLTTRDIHERKRAEQQLRRTAEQHAVVVRLGTRALTGESLSNLMHRASSDLVDALGADFAGVLEHAPDRSLLAPFAGTGRHPYGPSGAVAATGSSQAGLALTSGQPVIVRDWAKEPRFAEAPLLVRAGLGSCVTVPIPGPVDPFGVLTVHSRFAGRFNYDDAVFLQAVASILAAAVARADGDKKIRHQALHDAVTGLPNRTLFEDRLTRALTAARRHGRRLAVLFLDLDNFKRVNDSLGHAIGDVVLQAVAARFASCLRAEDTLARFGGDEFAILLPEIEADEDVIKVVERIHETLQAPLTTHGRQIITSASIGVALGGKEPDTVVGASQRDETAQTLVRDADLAMYAAKQQGPGRWEFFAEHMYDTAVRRLDLSGDLYHALKRDELEVHFQPIVALRDEEIMGMEALVRWNHPRHGLLPPPAFLPLAEETGLLVPLGRFVLREACRSLRRWQSAQPRNEGLYVTVNVGAHELNAPDFPAAVQAVLLETGLPPSSLILEVTEDVLLAKDEALMTRLHQVKELGVRLAVDDFGTGYSALSQLQSFPMDIIKIDKAFVDGLGESGEQNRLVKGIIELAHGLHLETVAEGIEKPEQAALLRAMRSELGQGFHFAKPLTSSDMDALLSPIPELDAGIGDAVAS